MWVKIIQICELEISSGYSSMIQSPKHYEKKKKSKPTHSKVDPLYKNKQGRT